MSKTKKYYWLKLREDFFDDPQDETIQYITEQNPLYTIFYLKLCLKALRTDGKMLRYIGSKCLPYDVDSLAKLTNMDKDTVRCALALFKEIGLIRFLDSGELFLTQIDEMVGSETEEAIKKRKLRSKSALEIPDKGTMSGQCRDNVPEMSPLCPQNVHTEIEIEIEKEIEIRDRDRDKEIEKESRGRDREKKDLFETLLPEYQISEPLADKIREFMRYRKEQHRFTYREIGLKSFLRGAEKAEQEYGSIAVIKCFDDTMRNGWQGVFYDKIKKEDSKGNSLKDILKEKYGRRSNEEV